MSYFHVHECDTHADCPLGQQCARIPITLGPGLEEHVRRCMPMIGPTPIYCRYCGYKTHSPADLAAHEAACPMNPANITPVTPVTPTPFIPPGRWIIPTPAPAPTPVTEVAPVYLPSETLITALLIAGVIVVGIGLTLFSLSE